MQVFHRHCWHWVLWAFHDALVLKWVAMQVEGQLPVNTQCYHLKGHGGMAAAIKQVSQAYRSGEWRYVYCTDIRAYYRHIIKSWVVGQLCRYIDDVACRDLCLQWLYCSIDDGDDIRTPEKGFVVAAR